MTDIEKGNLIRTYLLREDGRERLLAFLVEPSQRQLMYLALAAPLFSEPWPQENGEDVAPDLRFESSIPPLVLPRRTDDERGDWIVTHPEFLGVAWQRLLNQVADEVGVAIVKFLDERATTHEPAIAPIGQAVLDPILAERFLMNARDYVDLRKFGPDHLEIELRRELLKVGLMGAYKGIPLLVSRVVPEQKVYSVSALGACRCIVEPVALTVGTDAVTLALKFKFEFKLVPDPVIHRLDVVR